MEILLNSRVATPASWLFSSQTAVNPRPARTSTNRQRRADGSGLSWTSSALRRLPSPSWCHSPSGRVRPERSRLSNPARRPREPRPPGVRRSRRRRPDGGARAAPSAGTVAVAGEPPTPCGLRQTPPGRAAVALTRVVGPRAPPELGQATPGTGIRPTGRVSWSGADGRQDSAGIAGRISRARLRLSDYRGKVVVLRSRQTGARSVGPSTRITACCRNSTGTGLRHPRRRDRRARRRQRSRRTRAHFRSSGTAPGARALEARSVGLERARLADDLCRGRGGCDPVRRPARRGPPQGRPPVADRTPTAADAAAPGRRQ